MAEFITTQRGARSLLHAGYSYMINRRKIDGSIYWRCTKSRNSRCTGSVMTGPDDSIMSVTNTHNHPPDDAELQVKKRVASLKQKMTTSIQPLPQLYQEEVFHIAASAGADEVAAKMPTLAAMKSALYRRRKSLIPKLPQSRSEVCFSGEWANTVKEERFLLAEDGDGDARLVIFATNENLMKLVEADTLYVDGTFQTCPRVFYQIFTIHATYAGKHIPLVYCLLPNKRQETYERVFRIIQEKACHHTTFIFVRPICAKSSTSICKSPISRTAT